MALPHKAKVGVAIDNLLQSEKDYGRLFTIRQSHLRDAARIAFDALMQDISEHRPFSSAMAALAEKCQEETSSGKLKIDVARGEADALYFSYYLACMIEQSLPIALLSLLPPFLVGENIAFVYHQNTSLAFSSLKEQNAHRKAIYVSDLREALQSLQEQKAEYCLLPFWQVSGEPYVKIWQMVRQSNAYIAGYVRAEETIYALIGKTILPLSFQNPVVMSFDVTVDDAHFSLDCAKQLGGECYGIFSYREGNRMGHFAHFMLPDKESCLSYLLYVRLFHPHIKCMGCAEETSYNFDDI